MGPLDCSLPGSSVHGILQARILEWIAVSFSMGSSQPRDQSQVFNTAGKFFGVWATREVLKLSRLHQSGRPQWGKGSQADVDMKYEQEEKHCWFKGLDWPKSLFTFSITLYGKTRINFLANPIFFLSHCFFKKFFQHDFSFKELRS